MQQNQASRSDGRAVVSVERDAFSSYTAQEDALGGWFQEYRPLGPGRMRGDLTQVRFGSLSVFRERLNQPVLNVFSPPEDRIHLVIGMPGSAPAVNAYGHFCADESYMIGFEGEEQVAVSGAQHIIVVSFEPGDEMQAQEHRWTRVPGSARALGAWLSALIGSISSGHGTEELYRIAPGLIGDQISLHLAPLERPSSPRGRVGDEVLELLRVQPAAEMTVSALAGALSRRPSELRAAFAARYDRRLDTALLALRMDRVHRVLRTADPAGATVSGVAADHGFFHWGRFAQSYSRMFGELPSQTLQRRSAALARGPCHLLAE